MKWVCKDDDRRTRIVRVCRGIAFSLVTTSAISLACTVVLAAQQRNPRIATMAYPALTVPDVRGHTFQEAQTILRDRGLSVRRTISGNGPGIVGTVFGQTPKPGNPAQRGAAVDLYIVAPKSGTADGDSEFRTQVPAVVGEAVPQALASIRASRLQVGTLTRESQPGKPGTVVSQSPPAGRWVSAMSRVDIAVITPPPKSDFRVVPPLNGNSEAQAKRILNQIGLRLGVVSTGIAEVSAGTIYGQHPPPGSRVPLGEAIDVWVARTSATHFTVVPNLLHRKQVQAIMVLTQRRLQLGAVKSQEDKQFAGLVISQSPAPGTRVSPASAVNITLGASPRLVSVPDLVGDDTATAIAVLENARLRLGGVDQRKSNEGKGTILAQNPRAQAQVKLGTLVNVTVSDPINPTLTLLPDESQPNLGEPVKFHAHLEPGGGGSRYRFNFGDAGWTAWQSSSLITHEFRTAGPQLVQATAARGPQTVSAPPLSFVIIDPKFSVSLATTSTTPSLDQDVGFNARINSTNMRRRYQYQFVFGDGTTSEWGPELTILHHYTSRGFYAARVLARVGEGKPVQSGPREIFVGVLPMLFWGIGGTLAFSGIWLHGRIQFLRLVRTKLVADHGRAWTVVSGRKLPSESVRVRVVDTKGRILPSQEVPQSARKAGEA